LSEGDFGAKAMLLRFLSWLKDYFRRLMIGMVRASILIGAIAVGWVTWPVSAWLVGAYALHWTLSVVAGRLQRPGKRPAFRSVVSHAARGLARSVSYVGVGILVVAVAQAALWTGALVIEPAVVHQAEELLSYAHHQLLGVLSLEVLAVALVVLVAVVMVQPRSKVLAHFMALRKVASRVALVLLGVTSFTFFGALDMQGLDPEWRASERYRAHATLAEIASDTREMAAAAWAEAEVRQLDEAARKDFANFFGKARGTLLAVDIARAAAAELAGKAPHVSVPAQTDTRLGDVIPDRVRSYFDGQLVAGYPEPSLSELRAANERLVEHQLRVRAARTAAVELASEALSNLLPTIERPLVNAFVQGLSSSLARGALQEVMPARVVDIEGARDWVRTNVLGTDAAGKAHVPQAWRLDIAGLERGGVAGARESELLIAALVARLHTQHIAMQQRALRLAPLGSVHPSGVRPPRFVFRW
jgi:hypothetical protein